MCVCVGGGGGGGTSVEVMPAAAPAARRRGSVSCVPLGPLSSRRLYTSYEHSWHAEYGSTLSTWAQPPHTAAERRRAALLCAQCQTAGKTLHSSTTHLQPVEALCWRYGIHVNKRESRWPFSDGELF